ncbi:hypothetical protein [Longimicrobium terrae]|uniref:Type II secretion system protein GspG C-terminal domain-containing protein n=1 Tax=Longimicrobium terrae TaxID=1639882 RepID=A0A841GW68_9BACT|nr:hypothetical protein [Longimicrobium terrae]MBB4634890.1 hypothetical protein [Longimicrobium terrae]MBB6069285.1 hypothetical protein [Longimicrobium terrae]NNC31906.1 hypothetical protein [Longimicrobium terrae]
MKAPRVIFSPVGLAGLIAKVVIAVALLVLIAPPLRARAEPFVRPLTTPVHRVMTRDRVNSLARYLAVEVRVTGHAPQDRELRAVLHRMFPKRKEQALDPWGQRYYLRRRMQKFQVGSAGPDQRRGTRDDILSNEQEIVIPRHPTEEIQ